MEYSFIQANPIDHPALIASLASQVWREHYGDLLPAEQIDYMLDKFQSEVAVRNQIQTGGYIYYILCVGASNNHGNGVEPVGYMGVKFENERIFLSKFYILDSARGKGLGSYAFSLLKGMGARWGAKSVWLTVNRGNAQSIAIYRHLGFAVVREQVADIGEGYVMDDYVMEMELQTKSESLPE